MEDVLMLTPSNSMVVRVHEIDGDDLPEPAHELTSIKATKVCFYANNHPYTNVVDFKIHLNKSRTWKTIPVSSSGNPSLDRPCSLLGSIADPTHKSVFSLPFSDFINSPDGCRARLRGHISLAGVVRPEFCDVLAQSVSESASHCVRAAMKTCNKPRSFLVQVEVEVATTVEYQKQESRGRKRKGLCHH